MAYGSAGGAGVHQQPVDRCRHDDNNQDEDDVDEPGQNRMAVLYAIGGASGKMGGIGRLRRLGAARHECRQHSVNPWVNPCSHGSGDTITRQSRQSEKS